MLVQPAKKYFHGNRAHYSNILCKVSGRDLFRVNADADMNERTLVEFFCENLVSAPNVAESAIVDDC